MATATVQKVKLYQETYSLLRAYNTNLTFRTSFKNAVSLGKKSYVGTPIWLYLWTLSVATPHMRPEIIQLIQAFNSAKEVKDFKEIAESMDKLFESYWKERNEGESFKQQLLKMETGEMEHPEFISDEDHEQLSEIYNTPEGSTRENAFQEFGASKIENFHTPHVPIVTGTLPVPTPGVSAEPGEHLRGEESAVQPAEHLGGGQKAQIPEAFSQWRDIQQPFTPVDQTPSIPPSPPIPPLTAAVTPRFQFKSLLRPLKSLKIPTNISVSIKKFISRNLTPLRIASAVTGAIGAAVGYGTTNTTIGAAGGGLIGGSIPTLVKQRGFGQLVLTGFTKAGNTGASFISGLSGGGAGRVGGSFTRIAGGTGKKWALLFLLGFVLLSAFLVGFAPSPGTPGGQPVATGSAGLTGGSCPDQVTIDANKKDPNTCKYFGLGVNLFDTNISQASLDTYINKYSSIFINAGKGDLGQFRTRVNYIITKSKEVGITPVLALGYWKTESNFSTVGTRDLGCSPEAIDFYEQVDCKLGINEFSNPVKNPITNCARSKDAESIACRTLKGIRRNLDLTNPIKYPISTFDDFAEAYGSRDPNLECKPDGCKTNNNCISTYNKLVEVARELNACVVSTPAPTPSISTITPTLSGKIATCPFEGKRVIRCGSFMSDPKYNKNICAGAQPIDRGHCGLNYGCYKTIGGKQVKIIDPNEISNLRRAHSIDVDASVGEQVKLPFISGKNTSWFSGAKFGPLSNNEGGGYGHIFTTEVDGEPWVVYFIHMDTNVIPPPSGRGYQSGDPVVTVASTPYPHLHINIGKDPKSQEGGVGWLDPESLGMCAD